MRKQVNPREWKHENDELTIEENSFVKSYILNNNINQINL